MHPDPKIQNMENQREEKPMLWEASGPAPAHLPDLPLTVPTCALLHLHLSYSE